MRPMGTYRTAAWQARNKTLKFENGLILDLIRSSSPGENMAKKKPPDQERPVPKINLTRATFHTLPPDPRDPEEHFTMCWFDRGLETMVAEFNGDPPPTYGPMPPRPVKR